MWQQGVDTLAKMLSDSVAETLMLFQEYLCSLRQFDSVKDLYSNYQQFISFAGQQLDTRSFTDLVKRVEAFPATECAWEGLFVHYIIRSAISGTKCRTL
jgi:hypothetical protein